jgi:hypothetical protein
MGATPVNHSPATGIIDRVEANGAGPDSGEVVIRLLDDKQREQRFWIFLTSENRDEFFWFLRVAFESMWDGKSVRITSDERYGHQVVTQIKVV